MPVYFTYHPEVGLQAQITAPTTRKARTTYLDYLYRNDLIPWRGRQEIKKSIIVDQITAGEVPVDLELTYRTGESPGLVGEDQTQSLDPSEQDFGPVTGQEEEIEFMPRGRKQPQQPSQGRPSPYTNDRLTRSIVPGQKSKAAQSLSSGRGSRLSRSMIPKVPGRGRGV